VSSDTHTGIARRAVRGSAYGIVASGITISLGFLRTILLARFLAPDHFGVFTLAMFYVILLAQVQSFGLDQALISRQDAPDRVERTYVTLRIGLMLLAALLLVVLTPVIGRFYPAMPALGSVLLLLAGLELVKGFSTMQETWLTRDLAFRRLALTNVVAAVVMTLVAPTLAWLGWGVWALVAELGSGLLTRLSMTWGLFRVRLPRPGWDGMTVRWFWDYGKSAWGASNLSVILDRFDDFWIGTVLGGGALGYYSRAYEFARYPRRVIAVPLTTVFQPVFARLQAERLQLSQAFYRAAYVILRAGFLVAGAFALVMPEFIRLVIGEQWMPMLLAFRLMLVYTLLDTLRILVFNLFFVTGHPQYVWYTTRVQAIVFVPAVMVGAHFWGISGVALAADLMLLVGSKRLVTYLRQIVDFSLIRLTLYPLLALMIAGFAGGGLEYIWNGVTLPVLALGKLGVFVGIYLILLLLVEWHDIWSGVRWVRKQVQ
jgi:O-antigen/teichoic acid export membrane protein